MSLFYNNPRSSPYLYQLTNVWFSYDPPGEGETMVLQGLDLEVRKGEVFVLLSPSGEGKSTLLRVLSGLAEPRRGEVKIKNEDFYQASKADRVILRKSIGMVFEKGGLFDSMTAFGNLDLPLRERTRLAPAAREQLIAEMLESVGLAGTQELFPFEMSGGMQKRLCIARALILEPEVVLLDQPTAGLDPITSRSIVENLLALKKKHAVTMVLVTSDLSVAYQTADRIGFLYEGKLLECGDVRRIRESTDPVVSQFVRGLLEGPLTEGMLG